MKLWQAIVLGTLLWTPVAFGLAVLLGHLIEAGEREIDKWEIR